MFVPCLARIVVPGIPRASSERRKRRTAIYFEDGDNKASRDLLAEHSGV
jgi:hypothetical protein